MEGKYVIQGGKVMTPEKIHEETDLVISGGKIEGLFPRGSAFPPEYEVIRGEGLYVSPGFVDIHQHGGGGSDYMDDCEDTYYNATWAHIKHGMTSVMPTLVAAGHQGTLRAVEQYVKASESGRICCNLLGLHLEGPYLSPAQAGAMKPENIRNFDSKEYEAIYRASQGMIRRWSAAPEVKGAEEFAEFAKERGIALSIAHSDADFDTVIKAYGMGFRHVTHLYSGMSSVTRRGGFRIAGVVEAAFYLDGMNVEIIADGCHLPLSLLKLIAKIKKPKTVALITDAMRAAGQDVKESYIGSKDDSQPAIIEDGVAKMMSREAFAGSIATPDRLIRTMRKAGTSLEEAVRMMTVYPLRMMGAGETKGEIRPGYDADLCLFDEGINIKKVLVGGRIVFAGP
nr:N-acetylglucosamine-6-phosphate deacetylase [uncultured Acetatifactor sp.]